MTVSEAVGKWSDACTAVELKGRVVRDGNWQPLSRALRHYKDESALVSVVEQEGLTVLLIEPKPVDPKTVPAGKSAAKRPAFLLLVK
jgi:hypothetical protein